MPAISDRLQDELSLLQTMYPDSVSYNPISTELCFKPDPNHKAVLQLRLPEGYPETGRPLVLQACDGAKTDIGRHVSRSIESMVEGQEMLDAVVQAFLDCVEEQRGLIDDVLIEQHAPRSKTVAIWLHHLLATSKRKLALHPSSFAGEVAGVTKPGYPGVMLFTGLAEAVEEHVAELKTLKWQAFQVRYEAEEEWKIGVQEKATSVVEVETMAEVVQMVEEGKREMFLQAMGVK